MLETHSQGTPPSLVAALFLLCRELLPDWSGWPETAAESISLAGASKAQAYEILGRLRPMLPTLLRTPGRPSSPPAVNSAFTDVVVAVYHFLLKHPGSACFIGERREYCDDFRRFVVGLMALGQPGDGMPLEEFSGATGVPLGTLKKWLAPSKSEDEPRPEAGAPDSATPNQKDGPIATITEGGSPEPEAPAEEPVDDWISNPHLRTIAKQWRCWQGTFQAFCQMIRTQQRLNYSDTYIGNFLRSAKMRKRNSKGPVEAPWSGGTFRYHFPGAQWLGDGTAISLRWWDMLFVFNLEAILDSATNAIVGFTVSDTENEEALRLAYEASLQTTGGQPPRSLTLDCKHCNHSPGAREAVGAYRDARQAYLDAALCFAGQMGAAIIGGALQPALRVVCRLRPSTTILLQATPGRGQAKAPLEGAFGLFQQTMPPLVIEGENLREVARSFLDLIFTAWFRGRNGRPRKRLNGLSPAQAYQSSRPTEEQVREAMRWFQELQRRQVLARRTRQARRDPVRLELLRQGLAELGISDPEMRLATVLAYFSREAICQGLAIFRAKKELGTLPSDADPGRYLGGIIRNIDTRLELERIAEYFLEQRIRLGDITLRSLQNAAQTIQSQTPRNALAQAFTDRALKAEYDIDFDFWTRSAAHALAALPGNQSIEIYRVLSRRIANSSRADGKRREKLICTLAQVAADAA